jgi:TPR repeat protein
MAGRGEKRTASATFEDDSSSSSASSSSALSSSSNDHEARAKQLKSTVANISKHLTCALTLELMVDPVLAEDGNTYERVEILKWIATKSTSPLDPSCPLDASRVFPNRAVKQQIEELVASGELDDALCADYLNRKYKMSLEYAQKLFLEGRVKEAAELGLPVAQGLMANQCYHGCAGVAKDLNKCVEWAKKAAAGGDRLGQARLGYAYRHGEGGLEKDGAMALKWYEKAAEQGCTVSMNNIGNLYKNGGHGVTKNLATAVSWYRKSAEAGDEFGQYNLGHCYYYGTGVTKNLATARSWFQKAADQDYINAIRKLGCMMVKGEGGDRRFDEGVALWESAAAKGCDKARANLSEIDRVLRGANGLQ